MSLRVEVDGLESQVPIPAGVRPGDAFEAEIPGAAPPVVVATAVPSDEEVAAALQRAECDRAIAALDGARLVSVAERGGPAPAPHLTLAEQKLVNYRWSITGQQKRSKFPTSKAHISAVFHSFRLILGRAIISRNGLEAWMLFPERARAEHAR